MKKATKVFAVILAAVMMLCMFTGCEDEQAKVDEIAGTWKMDYACPEDDTLQLLGNLGFFEEEIAFIDTASLSFCQTVEFTSDKAYTFGYDVDASRQLALDFWTKSLASLYENRTSLNDVYSYEFDNLTEDEFLQLYAELFSVADKAALMDLLVEETFNYDNMADPFETGTFTISGNRINCTITGESEATYIEYVLNGAELTLTYSDSVEVYTRA